MRMTMNKWKKVGIAVGIGTAAVATAHMINKLIFTSATANMYTDINQKKIYNWKFGDISYTVTGEGSPLLLIHDLNAASSSYEWTKVVNSFGKTHTVYTIDLLGCGYSDKPNITYTTYMYTQLINDFIVNVINKKTNVIATGDAAPLTIMSAYNNPYLFNHIILVNPQDIRSAMINPDKKSNIRRILLNSPILGTLLYNICVSRNKLNNIFRSRLFYNPAKLSASVIDTYHGNAHLYGSSAKYLYTSTVCHYTTASIARAINKLDNCIYIVSGKQCKDSEEIIKEYTSLNPAIETAFIDQAKHLPQLEQPKEFIKTVNVFI